MYSQLVNIRGINFNYSKQQFEVTDQLLKNNTAYQLAKYLKDKNKKEEFLGKNL